MIFILLDGGNNDEHSGGVFVEISKTFVKQDAFELSNLTEYITQIMLVSAEDDTDTLPY